MIRSLLLRRQFLSSSIAALMLPLSGPCARGATSSGGIFPRPFAGSDTISSFASGLFWAEEKMPPALNRAIDAELARTNVPADGVAAERYRAEFFAWLAMRVIAPRTLRRAGYEALAVGCEDERELRPGGAAAVAQNTIGREFCRSPMPRLARIAYGATAHTSTCRFYASHQKMETVAGTGTYLARALLEPFSENDPSAADSAWIWNFAVAAINAMTDLSAGRSA